MLQTKAKLQNFKIMCDQRLHGTYYYTVHLYKFLNGITTFIFVNGTQEKAIVKSNTTDKIIEIYEY